MRGKDPKIILKQRLKRIKSAGLKPKPKGEDIPLAPLKERVQAVFNFSESTKKRGQMLFLVMYDIENDKVRTEIAKYLIRKGCTRIQKSVYMANLDKKTYNEIHQTLKEVQESYDNNDSIILIPVSADLVKAMKIIGKDIDIDMITGNSNVIFL